MMRKLLIANVMLAALAAFASTPSAAQAEESTAPEVRGLRVSDFEAKGGAEPDLAERVTSLMEKYAGAETCVRLVNSEALAEHAAAQAAGETCPMEGSSTREPSTCQESIQDAAHADLLLRGDLIKIGQTYVLTAMLLEIATQKTLFSGKVMANGREQLGEQTRSLVEKTAASLGCGKE